MELVVLTSRQAAEIGREWAEHHLALRRRDPRLASPPELAEFYESHVLAAVEAGNLAFGLHDDVGWRALAIGRHRLLYPDDPAQEIIFKNNLTWDIALLRPFESFAATELFEKMDAVAAEREAEMHYATMTACDGETIGFVARHGFEPCLAKCARPASRTEPPAPPKGVSIHFAKPGDGEKIVGGHLDELEYHHLCAPSQTPVYAGARDRQVRGCEDVIGDPNGLSLYAEADGQVIAVADGRIGYSYLRPTLMLPETLIGFIRSVGTLGPWRGRGVGKALSLRLALEMDKRGAERTELIYCPWNPLSSRFWPHLGYVPVSLGFAKRV